MTYEEIIKKNCENQEIHWWPRYAYHYTDIKNAINILKEGKLYSRINANKSDLMKNDNASRHVIDMTDENIFSYARFYFRPLTPTQYYNEGYKHFKIRYDSDKNANVPVPIFFVFNLEKLLSNDGVEFSNYSQAGYGAERYSGVEQFSNLEFSKIYDNGLITEENKKYRLAEILFPNEYDINNSLEFICCRSNAEKNTLLHLLATREKYLYSKYKDKIRVQKMNMFEKNGLFVEDVLYDGLSMVFKFNNSYKKTKYESKQKEKLGVEELEPIKMDFVFKWKNSSEILKTQSIQVEYDYQTALNLKYENLPSVRNAKKLNVQIEIERDLICDLEFNLRNDEIV